MKLKGFGKAILIVFIAVALLGALVFFFDVDLPKFDFTKNTETEAPSGDQSEIPSGDQTETPGVDVPTFDESTHVWGQYTFTQRQFPAFESIDVYGRVSLNV